MKKIDRYILGRYLTTFFFSLILFTVVTIVIDISEHTDDFAKSKLPASAIITDYYFGFIPRIVAMLFPLFIFISVIFFTSKMAGRSEVIAILSSGISFNRYMRPFMIGGLLMSLMLWIGYQSIVPKANLKWAEFEKNYIKVNSKGGKKSSYMQNLYFKETKNSWVGIKGYDTLTRVGNNFSLSEFKDEVMVKNMRAAGFRWDSSEKKWLFNNVVIRTFNGDTESVSYQHSYIATMNFQPIDLRKDEYLKDQMTTKELRQFIRKEKERGSEMINSLLVEKHNRTAIPASVFILTIIGSVLASKKVRGGSGIHLALGVIISVTYILFSRLSIVFATQGNFPPVLAAWFPNILFGIVAIYLYSKAQK